MFIGPTFSDILMSLHMARITLLRHAKAEIPDMVTADFDRALAARGRRNADRMGRFVRDNDMLPELIMLSPSARTRETYDLASLHWPDIPIEHVDSIYEASGTTLFSAIEAYAANLGSVMVIGHNPGLVVLLHNLVDEPPAGVNMSYFPTCCLADVGFDAAKIADIQPLSGRLLSFARVRELD